MDKETLEKLGKATAIDVVKVYTATDKAINIIIDDGLTNLEQELVVLLINQFFEYKRVRKAVRDRGVEDMVDSMINSIRKDIESVDDDKDKTDVQPKGS